MRPQTRACVVAAFAAVGAWAPTAQAYDFTIDLRTIGQGYQVRRFDADGSNELLSRRRLTQYLDLNVFDIGPPTWRGDDGGRNVVYFDASLRFETDFGGYMVGRPTGTDEIRELKQSQIDILFAFLGARNVGGRVDFQLGRQIHYDLVDFYAFDGGDAIVHLGGGVAVEAFSGTEVRGELPLSAPIYELDGTSAGSRDPATRPDQNAVLQPLVGAALMAGDGRLGVGDLRWNVRLAYRRVWSSTADRQPGEPESGVNDENFALTAFAALWNRVYLTGGLRLNLLLGEFDDQQLAARVQITRRQAVTIEHAYLAPNFDGDSIWNVFSTGAYRDLRATYELAVTPSVTTYARGFARFFQEMADEVVAGQDLGAAAPGGRFAAGGSLGAVWRSGRNVLRGDGYWDDGFGGRKLGADASVRARVARPMELEGRLTGYYWRSDLAPTTDTGVVFGAQAGGRYDLGPGVRLHLLAEDNVGTFYVGQYRVLAIVELAASL